MSGVGFEPTILVFERAKTLRVLSCVATALGLWKTPIIKFHSTYLQDNDASSDTQLDHQVTYLSFHVIPCITIHFSFSQWS
jgi:hypothetical protein